LKENNLVKKRIFVAKKPEFKVKNHALLTELQHNLQLETLTSVNIIQVYDVFHVSDAILIAAEQSIFSEKVTDNLLTNATVKAALAASKFFAIEALPGQFDQRATSAEEALFLLGASHDAIVKTAQLYLLNPDLSDAEFEKLNLISLMPLIHVLKISRLRLLRKQSQMRMTRFQFLKILSQRQKLRLLTCINHTHSPWKWLICCGFRIISRQ
jgi:phosphoribosylformylglycinamidine synthase (EC 6.3.5.3)